MRSSEFGGLARKHPTPAFRARGSASPSRVSLPSGTAPATPPAPAGIPPSSQSGFVAPAAESPAGRHFRAPRRSSAVRPSLRIGSNFRFGVNWGATTKSDATTADVLADRMTRAVQRAPGAVVLAAEQAPGRALGSLLGWTTGSSQGRPRPGPRPLPLGADRAAGRTAPSICCAPERQEPRRPPRPRLPVRPGDAALRRRRRDGRPAPLATNS